MHQKESHYAAELECMKEDNWIQCCRLELSVEPKSIISRWCFAKCKKSNVLRCLSHLQNDYFSIFNQSINQYRKRYSGVLVNFLRCSRFLRTLTTLDMAFLQ